MIGDLPPIENPKPNTHASVAEDEYFVVTQRILEEARIKEKIQKIKETFYKAGVFLDTIPDLDLNLPENWEKIQYDFNTVLGKNKSIIKDGIEHQNDDGTYGGSVVFVREYEDEECVPNMDILFISFDPGDKMRVYLNENYIFEFQGLPGRDFEYDIRKAVELFSAEEPAGSGVYVTKFKALSPEKIKEVFSKIIKMLEN